MNISIKNVIANYGSRLWGLIAMYLFTPLYTNILGIESYAIISFYNTLFGIIVFADAGIASAMDREFAKAGSNIHKFNMLKTFERIYAVICLILSLILILSSTFISAKWLNSFTIETNTVKNYIQLISIGVALQLMPSLYLGAMMGAQQQVKAGIFQFSWQLVKSCGGLLALFLTKDLVYFFIWQILSNVVAIYCARLLAFGTSYSRNLAKAMNLNSISSEIWRYIFGMFLVSILNAVNLQIDKILTSKLLDLKTFGYFSLTSIIGQIPYLIAIPIVLAVFPQMTKYISQKDELNLYKIFKNASFYINVIAIHAGILLVAFGGDIFEIWQFKLTLQPEILLDIKNTIALLAVGSTFFAAQQILFYLLLAYGKTKYSIFQTFTQVIIAIPSLIFCINRMGFVGASIPNLFIQAGGLFYLLWVVKKHLGHKNMKKHFLLTMILPLVVTGLTGILSISTVRQYSIVLSALLFLLCSIPANIYFYKKLCNKLY